VKRSIMLTVAVIATTMLAACSGSVHPTPSASATVPASALKTYTSQPYRFSVQYDPRRLTATDVSFRADMLNLAFGRSGQHGGMLLLATRSPRPATPALLRQWLARMVHSYAPDSKLGRVGVTKVGGLSALVSKGIAGKGVPGTLRTMTYAFGSGHYAYLFSLQGSLKDWPELLPAYNQVVSSFMMLQ
jgi:hypothetical protein